MLITSTSLTKEAVRTAEQIGSISLVDGEQLTHLMIEFDLGVETTATYKVKKTTRTSSTIGASWSAPRKRVRAVQ